MAASLLPPSYIFKSPFSKPNKQLIKYTQVKSQSFREDGTSASIVDSNIGVLRERIAELKMVETCNRFKSTGWNYQSGSYNNGKRDYDHMLTESIKVFGSIISAFGLVFFAGSLCIYLVYFLVHFSNS